VRQDVAAFIQAFFNAKKPVGAICISPALVALVLAKNGLRGKLTLGSGQGAKPAMDALNQELVEVPSAKEVITDKDLKLVTTAAYMFDDARLADVFIGIERCVSEVLKLI
jgi:enhancing lycopene biosynthesis protein 2